MEGRPVPDFVREEFEAYLRCGILSYGFLRLHCESCEKERIVAFSCKKRGFCPSCWAKRMAESAEHLVENVLPEAPYRQFVISFPIPLRYWLQTSQSHFSKVHKVVISEISRAYVEEGRRRGCLDPKTGSVTFIQRFGSTLKLNLHLHILALDGVYEGKQLHNLSDSWTDEKLGSFMTLLVKRVLRLLQREGYVGEEREVIMPPEVDELFDREEAYAAASQASMQGRIAFGPNQGRKLTLVHSGLGHFEENPVPKGPLCQEMNGFSIHCHTLVRSQERDKLERLLRYMARGPVSNNRLELLPGRRVRLTFKRPWSDGTTGVSMTYSEFIEKLMALIPPPRRSLTRWNGIFAPASRMRREIAPKPEARKGFAFQGKGGGSWARLLKRVFKVDVLSCPCGGRLRPLGALQDPSSCRRYLKHMGFEADPPEASPPRIREDALW
jgi:hypothetical protein